jgi:hypothetical protein
LFNDNVNLLIPDVSTLASGTFIVLNPFVMLWAYRHKMLRIIEILAPAHHVMYRASGENRAAERSAFSVVNKLAAWMSG